MASSDEYWVPDETGAADDFDEIRFSGGSEKRVSVYLLLDTSYSMHGPDDATSRPIDELNEALAEWAGHLARDAQLRHRAEVAVITFGDGGVVVHRLSDQTPFCPAAKFKPPTLEASGVTPMFDAIREAVALSERHKIELDSAGIQRFQSLMFMMTDGLPTDANGHLLPKAEWQVVADQIAALESARKLAFFIAGVSSANRELLDTLAPNSHWMIADGDFSSFLRLVSASAADDDPISHMRSRIQAMAK